MSGYEIYLERATLVYESGAAPLTLMEAGGKVKQPRLKGGDDPLAAFTHPACGFALASRHPLAAACAIPRTNRVHFTSFVPQP